MPFSADEIQRKSFIVARRGYDPQEVDAFLRAVGEDVRRLSDELADCRTRSASADSAPADPLGHIQVDVSGILQAARESAAAVERQAQETVTSRMAAVEQAIESMLTRASEESETAVREAKESAARLLDEAHTERTRLLSEANDSATRLLEEANTGAARLLEEASSESTRLREEAKSESTRLLDAAHADSTRMRDEARAQADRLETEAADLVATARDLSRELGNKMRERNAQLESLRSQVRDWLGAMHEELKDIELPVPPDEEGDPVVELNDVMMASQHDEPAAAADEVPAEVPEVELSLN